MKPIVLEGCTLHENYTVRRNRTAPLVEIGRGSVIDDSLLEKPTIVLGNVASGKTTFTEEKLMRQIFAQRIKGDSVFVSAAKRSVLKKFCRLGKDIVLDINAKDPSCIWNMFMEVDESPDPETTLRELSDVLFAGSENKMQPFFSKGARTLFRSLFMYLKNHYPKPLHNGVLYSFIQNLTLQDERISETKVKLGLLSLIRDYEELKPMAKYIGNGSSAQALGVLGEMMAVINDTFQGGATTAYGTFTVRRAIEEGMTVYVIYDFAERTKGIMNYYSMILNQAVKLSCKDDGRKTWFFLDEAQLIGKLSYLQNALSFGREYGFRIILGTQNIQLLNETYEQQELDALLSLFPNIFCFYTSDDKTRDFLKKRYGKNTVLMNIPGLPAQTAERDVIQDADFLKIAEPGNCIVSLSGYEPFILRNHND